MSSAQLIPRNSGNRLRVVVAETPPGEVFDVLNRVSLNGTVLELTAVSAASTLIPTIKLIAPELVFVDLCLRPDEPLELVRNIRRTFPNIPLILLVSLADKAIAESALQEGVTDYLLKGHAEPQAVERVLRVAIERNTVNGLTDLLRDTPTGLYNREGFAALAVRAIQNSQKSGGRMILLTAEISNLHDLVQEFGPSTSQQIVREIAELLRGSFRRTDVLARLAESRFAVLALDALEPTTAIMRQRIERHLAALNAARKPWGEIDISLMTAFWNAGMRQRFPELEALIASCAPLQPQAAPECGLEEVR